MNKIKQGNITVGRRLNNEILKLLLADINHVDLYDVDMVIIFLVKMNQSLLFDKTLYRSYVLTSAIFF